VSLATKLVGRSGELAALEQERRRAGDGRFRCVLIVADPGVGKTRLAGELLARPRRGSIGLSARAHAMGATASFGLWAEALEGHLRTRSGDEVVELCGGFLDDLAVLFHSVAAVRGSAPAGEVSRARLLEGLTVLVGNVARSAPVTVVLDDVHLADPSSWEGLHYLAHNVPAARLLVVATARGAELAGSPLGSSIVFGLEQEGLLRRLELGPLDPGAIRELAEISLGEPPPPALASWLAERSQGNPLFALGLLQALLDEGADLHHPALARLPEGLAGRVGSRLRSLDEPALSTLQVLAVLGRRVGLAELVDVSGRSAERLGSILEDLVRARLVVETEQGRQVSCEIAHPLIAETIYQTMGATRRRVLHRLMARALLGSGRAGAAAPHYARSADTGDPEAVEALLEAVRQAEEQGSFREALEVLGALVELLPADDERWRDVAEVLSCGAEWVIDHQADAHGQLGLKAMRAVDSALEASPTDLLRRAEVKFRLADFLTWGSGELAEAEGHSVAALELYEQAGDRSKTMLAANQLAYIRWIAGDVPAFDAASRRLLEEAEAAGDRFVILQALNAIGIGAYFGGRFGEAEQVLLRSAAMAREDHRPYRLTMSLGVVGLSLAFRGRLEEARLLLREAKSANPQWRDTILPEWELMVPWLAGDYAATVAAADDVLARNPLGLGRRRAGALVFAALSAAETGQVALAHRYLGHVAAAYGERRWFFWSDYGGHAEALLAWRSGRTADAVGLLRQTTQLIRELPAFVALVLADLAEVAAESDDPEAAGEASAGLADVARRVDGPLCRALAALGAAWSSLAGGDGERAGEEAKEAVRLLSGTGCRAFSARALAVLGRSLQEADRVEARRLLREAAGAFEACGALWRRDRTLDLLRTLGPAGRRAASTAQGLAALTARERDVVRLAAQGLTARQIGERLVIGRRTVEGHLASAYAKLGLDSKLELVRRAGELGL
jgi:DNA-binding CsgD family transcriptional regulator/tetratricopeptide (TPR) repeat protein